MYQRVRSRQHGDSGDRSRSERVALPPEEAFAVLRNDRRRAAITVLASEGEARSVTALARAVAASEHGIPTAHVTERQHKCVYVSLLQIHLPTLAEKGLIEWEGCEGPITGAGSIGALAETIEFLEEVCEDDRQVEREGVGDTGEGPIP